MFKSFKFNDLDRLITYFDNSRPHPNYKIIGKNEFECKKKLISDSIEDFYLNSKKTLLDGNAIMKKWFPQVKSHIFISHSHADIEKVYELAGFLKSEFGLSVFIDSAIWGYADELLYLIDTDHCYKEETKTYAYEQRNITTSNVYLMLLNSLQTMIDSTECILFVETPNSIKKIPEQLNEKTYSPWIFSELNMLDVIRVRLPERLLTKEFENRETPSASIELKESLQVVYDVSEQLNRIKELSFQDIVNWKSWKIKNEATINLDKLYEIKEKSNESN